MKTLSVMLIAGLLAASTQARYSGGIGTAGDPYQIATAADLIALGESPGDYDKHFVLTADIDLDPNLPGRRVFDRAVIAPDVNDLKASDFEGPPFTGVFDGRGHSLVHLSVEGKDYVGLFGKVGSGAQIARLVLEAVDVNATGYYVGGLVGGNEGCVITSRSTGMVKGHGVIGGLVGENEGGIVASHSTATVRGFSWLGGLVGTNNGGIIASYSSGTVSGSASISGVASGYVGGLAGANDGYIVASYSDGTVSGQWGVGGLVGHAYGPGGITMCYSTAAVSGDDDGHTGGLVGYCGSGETCAVASFWSRETAGQTAGGGDTGPTAAQMRDIKTFLDAGWDFVDEVHHGTCDYWEMSPGEYPRLRFQAGAGPVMPEGAGTPEQPYVIRDARDLGTVWFEPLACYCVPNRVDLKGITWSMAVVPWFGGTFNGGYGGLRSLHIRGGGYLGLFGQLDAAATICLLGLVGTEVVGTGGNIGGLVGVNRGTITDCCSIAGVVKSGGTGEYVGGLTGANYGSIATSLSDGVVIGGEYGAGGLVGCNGGRVTACHAAGSVDGVFGVGGLVGAGGGTIAASYSTGAVRGHDQVGGLLGAGWGVDLISACYSITAVFGKSAVGGLLGYLDSGAVRDCYSISAIIGDGNVGGLVGYLDCGTISRCYSVSAINGESGVGPLAGSGGLNEISDCLWDTQVCGRTTDEGGIGKTTAEMQTAATFLALGWDFAGETANGVEDIWCIDEGNDYPHLSWEPGEDCPCGVGDWPAD
jgi:hypothetical protein